MTESSRITYRDIQEMHEKYMHELMIFRKETADEFKAVRREMGEEFKAIRAEMAADRVQDAVDRTSVKSLLRRDTIGYVLDGINMLITAVVIAVFGNKSG